MQWISTAVRHGSNLFIVVTVPTHSPLHQKSSIANDIFKSKLQQWRW